jgi:hypothetical protein
VRQVQPEGTEANVLLQWKKSAVTIERGPLSDLEHPKGKHAMFTRSFLLIFIMVLSCASLLFAQAEGSTAKEQIATKAQKQAEQKASEMKIHGKVVSVDVTTRTLIVKTRSALDTLNVESGARIMLGMMELSKETTLGDILTDVNVTVTWEITDGKKTATKIVEESSADSKWKEGTH